ncbi:NERD domain-containing protein [Candidatus Poriferisodalis sp.]|uniref:nuclease-related domain-containing DEAD/DEAH box helicase n=1 Tax=Candidatus Poriferisodalis sp. TaxID=3101277 RepID=UPI003D105B51
MAHIIPPDYPPGTSPGETLIFDALRERTIGRTWTVLHSLHIPEHVRQVEGEADFVFLMPGLGVLTLEVKGHLRADYADGAWYLGEGGAPDFRGPFRQSEMAARSIKKKVVSALPSASKILFWSAVLFTHCTPAVRTSSGDWHPWQLLSSADLDSEDLDSLLGRVMRKARNHAAQSESARWFDPTSTRPTESDCARIRRILRPDVHFLPATSTIRQQRTTQIRRFTEEQLEVIEGLDGVNQRALIEGPAGTGKTVLALEGARRANAQGERTALLCFNQQLAAYLRAEAERYEFAGVDILTFHALLRRITGESGSVEGGHEYWSRILPERAMSVLLDNGPLYDALIVDEAQDLASPAYLDVMDAVLTNELSNGSWRMFGDFESQAIYSTGIDDPIAEITRRGEPIARYRLRRNCRNLPRVAEYIVRLGGLKPAYSRVMRPDCGPEGTPRTSFYPTEEDQEGLLGDALSQLQASGEFSPQDIVVLSPVVNSCARRVADSGKLALRV